LGRVGVIALIDRLYHLELDVAERVQEEVVLVLANVGKVLLVLGVVDECYVLAQFI